MNPVIENKVKENNTLKFTLSGVNVSLANALRRTIMSDIPIVVFKTTPYEENNCNIITNTSRRFHNEIIKQRLSCIPIHITDLEMPLKNYILEVDVENKTDSIVYVTTENFKIKNEIKGDYLSQDDVKKIFPPNDFTGYYIDFLRLMPRISNELPGEKIHLTCKFDISTAKVDGMFNVVSTCSYSYTVDEGAMMSELEIKKQFWKDQGYNDEQISYEAQNWKLLDGLRITKLNSFDFIIETIGIYENEEIIKKACSIIIEKLVNLNKALNSDDKSVIEIKESENIMDNCYDIILHNEDYTIGKILEYVLYSKFFEELKTIKYCGFKKMHPHDSYSIIRVSYDESTEFNIIKNNLNYCTEELVKVYIMISKSFDSNSGSSKYNSRKTNTKNLI